MTDQRFIIEMGMGNDLHGQDYTKAAGRAIEDAMRHSSIQMFAALGIDPAEMRVQVTVAVARPDELNLTALQSLLPRGRATVSAVKGGLDVTNPDNGEITVIATVAIQAFLPAQSTP